MVFFFLIRMYEENVCPRLHGSFSVPLINILKNYKNYKEDIIETSILPSQ